MKLTIKGGVLRRCSLKPGETEVVIPEGVTKIDGNAFYNCTTFKGCTGLTSIVIPDSVSKIGYNSFRGCTGLTSVVIPNSVKEIGDSAFEDCTALTSVVLSKTKLGEDVFAGCTSLKEIIGPEIPIADYSVESKPMALAGFFKHLELFTNDEVADGYRKYCYQRAGAALSIIFRLDCATALKDVFADKNKITVKNFEEKFLKPAQDANAIQCVAFLLDWKNQNISIEKEFKHMERELKKDPYNVADMKKLWKYSKNKNGTICINAYKGNETEIEIPERIGKVPVTVIEEENERYVFPHGAAITQITIPGSMKKLGYNAFRGCSGLTSVVIPNSVKEIGSDAFAYTGLTSVVIPNSVKEIASNAFEGCDDLTSIDIPKSVKKIGSFAFDRCTALTSIIVDENNSSYSGDERGVLFNKEKTALIRYPIGNTATSYDIPNSVREVGHSAFCRCTGLTNIFIPNSVEKIVDWAFSYCTSLTSVVIPNSVKEIGDYAFSGCTGLTNVIIPGSVEKIGDRAFEGCTNLANVMVPESVKKIGAEAFYGTKWFDSQPDGMIYINKIAYRYKGQCPSTVKLKVDTKIINQYAFEDCSGLTSIVLPESVKEIGNYAFSGCTSLTSVVIPDSVKEIDWHAFDNCNRKKFIIHAPSGSYAEQYAKEYGIKFERT